MEDRALELLAKVSPELLKVAMDSKYWDKLQRQHRMTAMERDNFVMINACWSMLRKYLDEAEPMIKRRIPTQGWRDYKLMVSIMHKIVAALLCTLPVEQIRTVQHDMAQSEIKIKSKGPAGKTEDEFLWAVSRDEIVLLVAAAIKGKCFACEKKPGQGQKCWLNDLIHTLPVQQIDTALVGCMTRLDENDMSWETGVDWDDPENEGETYEPLDYYR